jgi:hypothetical protein
MRIPFVINGDFSKEFLESMGYKPFVPELVEITAEPVMPLQPIKLAYSEIKINNKDKE